MGKCPLVQ